MLLFIDPVCPAPYNSDTLARGFLGGTEATVVRVVDGLGDAVVMQHNRIQVDQGQEAYRPRSWMFPSQGAVVVIRGAATALDIRQRGWGGPLYLWLHDIMDTGMALNLPHLRHAGIQLIAVSHWHRRQMLELGRLVGGPHAPLPEVKVIYNPLDPAARPRDIDPDPDRLAWISMPNKGLHDVLNQFQALRARNPKLELHIANPGQANFEMPGVRVLGLMPHGRALDVLAGSFCMFCPNATQPETFGIVYAEANAVGTPALAHDFGAASEILDDPRQLVDIYKPDQIIERFETWRREGRPKVVARPQFSLEAVVGQWRTLDT